VDLPVYYKSAKTNGNRDYRIQMEVIK
jgi:hypothetical protein